eukprot:scaffold212936_cov33-Tisochrysis_lutea.AAC.4
MILDKHTADTFTRRPTAACGRPGSAGHMLWCGPSDSFKQRDGLIRRRFRGRLVVHVAVGAAFGHNVPQPERGGVRINDLNGGGEDGSAAKCGCVCHLRRVRERERGLSAAGSCRTPLR